MSADLEDLYRCRCRCILKPNDQLTPMETYSAWRRYPAPRTVSIKRAPSFRRSPRICTSIVRSSTIVSGMTSSTSSLREKTRPGALRSTSKSRVSVGVKRWPDAVTLSTIAILMAISLKDDLRKVRASAGSPRTETGTGLVDLRGKTSAAWCKTRKVKRTGHAVAYGRATQVKPICREAIGMKAFSFNLPKV